MFSIHPSANLPQGPKKRPPLSEQNPLSARLKTVSHQNFPRVVERALDVLLKTLNNSDTDSNGVPVKSFAVAEHVLKPFEIYFSKLPDGKEKDAAVEALRKGYEDLANAIIQKLGNPSAKPDSAATTLDLQAVVNGIKKESRFFTESTLGRVTMAKVSHLIAKPSSSSHPLTLPANFRTPDMLAPKTAKSKQIHSTLNAKTGPSLEFVTCFTSKTLYPHGLFAATSDNPNSELPLETEAKLLAHFETREPSQNILMTRIVSPPLPSPAIPQILSTKGPQKNGTSRKATRSHHTCKKLYG